MNRVRIATALATLLVALTLGLAVAAAPPLPSSFYGTVTMAGQNLPAGITISAFIGNTHFAETTTFIADGLSVYRLDVPGDAPDTPAVEGGREGDTIRFQVMDFEADQTATWHSGTYTRLNLTASGGPPIALGQSVTTDEDTPRAITLTAIDTDPLTFTVVTTPAFGLLTGTPPSLTYTPNADYFGPDSFTFRANDGTFDSNIATISITVQPVNDAPRLAPIDDVVMDESESRSVPVSAADPDGDAITLSASQLPAFARFADHGDGRGTLTLTPDFDDAGVYPRVTMRASDARLSSTREFTITVRDATLAARFTVPGESHSVATWDNNIGSFQEGASIAAFSSQYSASYVPSNAIDDNPNTSWFSANGQAANQFIVLQLPQGQVQTFDRVRLISPSGNDALKNFEIQVSTTTTDTAAFTTVLSSTALNNTRVQEFPLATPVQARYVRLLAKDNYGSACCIGVSSFEVIDSNLGGVPSFSATTVASYLNVSFRPEELLDASPSTVWLTANGQVTNQSVKLRLAGGEAQLVDRVRLQPAAFATADALKDFEVLVSATTDEDSALTSVLSGTLLNNSQVQEFLLPGGPVRARYVKLLARNNYGSAGNIRVATFHVMTVESEGNIISLPAATTDVARNQSPAQIANGATVITYSSAFNSSTTPDAMLDYIFGLPWATASLTNQFAIIQLAGSAPHTLRGVQVSPRLDGAATQSVRDFEIWVSSTTSDDAAFTRVLSTTVLNNNTLQTFLFAGGPVQARYVKYMPRSNYGDPNYISTTFFDVLADGVGGVVAASSQYGYQYRPEQALDGNTGTPWLTQQNAVTNQWIKVLLEDSSIREVYGVRIFPYGGAGPRDFEIRVSTTTADDSAFATVFSGTLAASNTAWEIGFGDLFEAKYVEFFWRNGHSTSYIGVQELEVLAAAPAGAALLSFSSESSASNSPDYALDFNQANQAWLTANGQSTNQWLKIVLPRADIWLIDHVALQPTAGAQAARDFEVQVSTTSPGDAAFRTVVAGTLRNDGTLQHFFFPPAPARFVRLLLKNNYGGPYIALQTFWAYSPQIGSVETRFLDRSTDSLSDIAGYAWDFGDGATSTKQDPVHVFAAPGVYSVTLTITNTDALTDQHTILYHAFGPPQADFSFTPALPNEAQSVQFADDSTDPFGPMVAQTWNWGDGTTEVINQAAPIHAFDDNGIYTVTLRAANTRGIYATITRVVSVANLPPIGNAGPDQTVVWGQNWNIAPSISDLSSVDRNSLRCEWNFGDGQTAQVINCNSSNARVSHAYSLPGIYTATLTVSDKDGASASDVLTATVDKRLSVLSGNPPGPVNNGQTTVAARLQDCFALQNPMAGKIITFTVGSQSVSATTDISGTSAISVTAPVGVNSSVPAVFAGDDFYYGFSALAPNLLRNGSLEESSLSVPPGTYFLLTAGSEAISHWRVIGMDIHYLNSFWQNADCYHSVDLDGLNRGGLEQSFPTIPGQPYEVQFFMAGNPASGPTLKPMSVSAAGQSDVFYFDISGKSYTNMGYRPRVWSFVANGVTTTLRFESLTSPAGYGPVIDRAQVIPVSTATTDLVVGKNDDQTAVQPGQTLTYTVTISNVSGRAATTILVTDTLPANTTFVSASDGGRVAHREITWPAFDLIAGEAVSHTVTVRVNDLIPPGVAAITNTLVAVDDGTHGADPTPDDNTARDVDTLPQVIDLSVSLVDRSGVTGDWQTLAVSGSVAARLANQGGAPAVGEFSVTFFEDANGNSVFDAGTDTVLGRVAQNGLAARTTVTVTSPVSGTVTFRDNLIYAFVDSGAAVAESDETNNYSNTGLACEFRSPPGPFNPVLEWSWTSSTVVANALNVMMTPAVIDLNGDGVPDVVFASTADTGGGWVQPGPLRAVSGNNGVELFSVISPTQFVNADGQLAVGDIDRDGRPEIVAAHGSGNRLIAFENDGAFKWLSPSLDSGGASGPALADLDGDGTPEIVVGRQVLNNTGAIRWTGTGGRGDNGGLGSLSLVADINMDGRPEVVAGNTVYDAVFGDILWQAPVPDGFNAVANFDADPFPEIVLVNSGAVRLLENTGAVKWGPVSLPGGGVGGPPTVADYDGDGQVEIGVAGASRYTVFETDGRVKWSAPIQDGSSNRTGSSVFDFEGDGSAEVVYHDERRLFVFRGTDGAVLFQTPSSSCTWYENPLVADVDGDGNAEIVAVANNNCGFGPQRGVFVFGDASDRWVGSRKIWNQHTYHITNIGDDGSIPAMEANNWQTFNNYRQNLQTIGSMFAAPDLTASFLRFETQVDAITLTARIGNGGAVQVGPGMPVAFYDGNPAAGGVLLGTVQTTKPLKPGEFEDVSFDWLTPFSGTRDIYVVADDNGARTGTHNECDETNNVHHLLVNLNVVPDLVSAKTDDLTFVQAGQILTYTLTVSNVGAQGATGVTITDTLPADTTFVAASHSGSESGGLVTWAAFDLATGASVTRTVIVRVDDPLLAGAETITNTASVADDGANGQDPTPKNNTAVDVNHVDAAPELQISKDDGGLVAAPGEVIVYSLVYTNAGGQGTTGVVISETVPANTSFDAASSTLGWSCADASPAGTTCAFLIGGLSAGTSGVVDFAVAVADPMPAGTTEITNTAIIGDDSDSGPDRDPSNNQATDTTPVNIPPIANDDSFNVNEDSTDNTLNVLGNDSDPNGDSLTITVVGVSSNGTVINNTDHLFYTPDPDFNSTDVFTYTISDGELTASATVMVIVNPVNDPPLAMDDEATTPEDAAVTIDILANDSDVDGDTLTVISVTLPSNGAAVVNLDNTITYTPTANFDGRDSFAYTISDGQGGMDTAVVRVTVTPVNDDPVAIDDEATTREDTAITIDVLANDSDIDGDLLTVVSITLPMSGTAMIHPDNTVTYTPTFGLTGIDSFTYTIVDANGGSDVATVRVTVTPAPAQTCDLYPIALHVETLAGVSEEDVVENIFNGARRGNFGWLTWAGSPSVGTLVTSLTPPGESFTYINPSNPADHVVSIGDWVQGRPGVANSSAVREALDALKTVNIVVPVWDAVAGSGNNAAYRVVNFARVRLTDYHLPGQDRISARFLGYVTCGGATPIPQPASLAAAVDSPRAFSFSSSPAGPPASPPGAD